MGPHDQHSIDDATIARYLSGESSASERIAVDHWASVSPENAQRLRKLADAWGPANNPQAQYPVDRLWGRLTDAMKVQAPSPVRRVHLTRPWQWTGVAAALIITVVFLGGVLHHRQPSGGRTYATAIGQRLAITLSDGTRVTLGPASHLQVPTAYAAKMREVNLDGEGYFSVIHDPKHPFAVRARGVLTRDVGTSFNVRAYAGDQSVRVAVAEGEVSLRTAYLTAGDVAEVTDTGFTVTHHANVAALVGWQQGRLVFEDAALGDVVRDLGRALDIQITIADSSLATHQVSGSFDNEPVDQVLDDLSGVIGAQYERVGRHVVLRRRTSRTQAPVTHTPAPLTTAAADHR